MTLPETGGPHWREKCKVGHLLENKCKVLEYLLKYLFSKHWGFFFFFFLKQGDLRVSTTVGRFQSLGVKDMGSYAAPSFRIPGSQGLTGFTWSDLAPHQHTWHTAGAQSTWVN